MNKRGKVNIIGHIKYDFENQTETFTPNPDFMNNQNNPQDIIFNDLLSSNYVTLFMPHFNQNVRLRIEARSVWDSETPCIRLHGRVGKRVIVSEPIFNQKDLNEMSHIFQPIKS